MSEGSAHCIWRRSVAGAVDGRSRKSFLTEPSLPEIDQYLASVRDESPGNVTDLFNYLVAEHEHPVSQRNLQRYAKAATSAPGVRARRLVETPPGAQAQAHWTHFPKVLITDRRVDLLGFSMQVSFCRGDVIARSESRAQLAWLTVPNEPFRRHGGVAATPRIDNPKTAIIDRPRHHSRVLNIKGRSYLRRDP